MNQKLVLNNAHQECLLAASGEGVRIELRHPGGSKAIAGRLLLELDPHNTIQVMHPYGYTDYEGARPVDEPVLQFFGAGQPVAMAAYSIDGGRRAHVQCQAHGLHADAEFSLANDSDRIEIGLRLRAVRGDRRMHIPTVRFGLAGMNLPPDATYRTPPQAYGWFGGIGRMAGHREGHAGSRPRLCAGASFRSG
jgi:hypothetical protein